MYSWTYASTRMANFERKLVRDILGGIIVPLRYIASARPKRTEGLRRKSAMSIDGLINIKWPWFLCTGDAIDQMDQGMVSLGVRDNIMYSIWCDHVKTVTFYTPIIMHSVQISLRFVMVLVPSLSSRVTSLALGQSYDCPSASEVTLEDRDKYVSHG